MTRDVPPLNTLAAFESAARHQSFSRAAEELHVTDSAISHRIKLLEDHLGHKLFLRTRGGLTLTGKGAYYLAAVQSALEILKAASSNLGGSERKMVRLSIGPALARNWLVGRLGEFYRLHADIDLEISATQASGNKLNVLKSGEADIAIRYGTEDQWGGYHALRLLEGNVFPVCSPAYRKSRGGLRRPKELLDALLLRLPGEPWKPWFAAAGLQGEEPARGPVFSDADLMLDAAVNGQGVALARSMLVREHLSSGRLVIPFDISIPASSSYFAVYSDQTSGRPEIRTLLDWLQLVARSTR
jgi:LysR family transcriptional regulator, glycine cleavage system transcriptional activator